MCSPQGSLGSTAFTKKELRTELSGHSRVHSSLNDKLFFKLNIANLGHGQLRSPPCLFLRFATEKVLISVKNLHG